MGLKHTDRLADVVAALGLAPGDQAALQAELDMLRTQMLWQPDPAVLAACLRRVRGLLAPARDNRLARGAVEEIDAILGEE